MVNKWYSGGSKTDKGKCKAEKEMAFLSRTASNPIDALLWMLLVYHLILSEDSNALIIRATIDVPLYLYC